MNKHRMIGKNISICSIRYPAPINRARVRREITDAEKLKKI